MGKVVAVLGVASGVSGLARGGQEQAEGHG